MLPLKIGATYEHYKSTKKKPMCYKLLNIAHHTETGEEYVVYQALYDTKDLGPTPVFVRPLQLFVDSVMQNNQLIPRFTLVQKS